MGGSTVPDISKENLVKRARDALNQQSEALEAAERSEPLEMKESTGDDDALLKLAISINLCARRLYDRGLSQNKLAERLKERFFIFRFEFVERLALGVFRWMWWNSRGSAQETAEALEAIAEALRYQNEQIKALRQATNPLPKATSD